MDPISIIIIAFAIKYAGTDLLYAMRGKANLNHESKAKALSTRAQVRAQKAQLRNEKTKARLAKVKARGNKSVSPARRYAQVLKDDAFEDLLDRHTRKREARKTKADNQDQDQDPGKASVARGPARVYISNKAADARRDVRKWWNEKWEEAERNRHDQKLKARPNDDVIPGAVIPNVDSEPEPVADEFEPIDYPPPTDRADGEIPIPADAKGPCDCGGELVPTGLLHVDEGDGGAMVDLKCNRPGCGISSSHYWAPTEAEYEKYFGHPFEERDDEDDSETEEGYTPHTDLTERQTWLVKTPEGREFTTDDPEMYAHLGYEITAVDGTDHANGFEVANRYQPYKSTNPTPEGTNTMSNTSIEAVDLPTTIANCSSSAENAQGAATGIELTVAGLQAGGTSGPAISSLLSAQEHLNAAAIDLRDASAELQTHLVTTEAYAATGGHAGSKEFVTGG